MTRVLSLLLLTVFTAAPVAQDRQPPAAATVSVQLLAFNDFHGTLETRAGSNGRIATIDAGGVEYLAAHLARLRAENPNTITVSGGDNIGASPLLSSMFHDEPTIEALNGVGLQLSAVGNHELDEGWAELSRMQRGGCHPVDGCQDLTPFAGARFQFLAANVWVEPRLADSVSLRRARLTRQSARRRLFPASAVRTVAGVKIGFIGLTLRNAPQVVSPSGIRGLSFQSEADAANAAARQLRAEGVHTIVVLIHQGGVPEGTDINGCENFSGPIVEIAQRMSESIDVVVSGHTHEAYTCTIAGKLVTSAASYSRLITDIDLQIDRRSGRVTSKSARNVIVTRDLPTVPEQTTLISHYQPFAATLGSRIVGSVSTPITREANEAGECAMGDLIADGMLAAAREPKRGGAVLALMNPGGIRAELLGEPAPPGAPRPVTYARAFDVLPFGNQIVVRTLTGEALLRMLEQQFDNRTTDCGQMLQVSDGFTYRYDPSRPKGERINAASVTIKGQKLDATARYRVASNDFLWAGGDNFTVAKEGFDPVAAGADIDILIEHLHAEAPVAPRARSRIQVVAAAASGTEGK